MLVDCSFSMNPRSCRRAKEEEEIQRRSNACSQ
jgi:hypothetical protein